MPIKTANEVYRDYETDGVPASGAHKPIKADIREMLSAIEGSTIPTPRIVTTAGPFVVADSDSLLVLNKAVASATAITLGAVAARGRLPLVIKDWAGNAGDITITPAAGETIEGLTTWIVVSTGGAGLGGSIKLYPSEDLDGWLVAV